MDNYREEICRLNDEYLASVIPDYNPFPSRANTAPAVKPAINWLDDYFTKKAMPKAKDNSKRKEWAAYRREAWQITNLQPLELLENYNRRGFKDYHLDHVLSIWEGFKRNIPASVVGHISNLRMIPHKQNTTKGTRTEYTNLFNESGPFTAP